MSPALDPRAVVFVFVFVFVFLVVSSLRAPSRERDGGEWR